MKNPSFTIENDVKIIHVHYFDSSFYGNPRFLLTLVSGTEVYNALTRVNSGVVYQLNRCVSLAHPQEIKHVQLGNVKKGYFCEVDFEFV